MLKNELKKLKISGKLKYLSYYESHLYGLSTETYKDGEYHYVS